MAGRIPQHFIDDLVGRADIVEIVGSRVPLKKAGREYKACCPFHDEKSPSFWVSPEKQFYHCFGCGAHGTALGFLMSYDHLPFPEAVEELATRLGIEVPREAAAAGATRGADDALYALTAEVARFYAAELERDARARDYAQRRGLSADTLQRFQIGYAANSWSGVLARFGRDEDACRRLAQVGLVIEREGHSGDYYDRFRDRLVFPIRDPRGRVLGFGGRVIEQGEPKYLNSPETVLFHKGRELYGMYEVRQSRAPLRRLLVVEGYMDVVQLHQSGVGYAVATLGTATTPEHLTRAFRQVSELVFCFDGDRAGRGAAWRALTNALPEARAGREMRFLFLPDGEDPDSLVAKEGAAAFEARLAAALPLSEYLVRQLMEETDVAHADGKAKLLALARPLLERVPAGPFRELLLDRLAEAIRVSPERLRPMLGGVASGAADALAAEPAARAATPRRARPGLSAGRGSLVRQSVQNLLHFPQIAQHVPAALREELRTLEEPGAPILRELLEQLREDPASHTGQLLERWRERTEYEHLARLAAAEALAPDGKAAARELQTALQRLVEQARFGPRLDALIAKGDALSEEEKVELQGLMAAKAALQRPRAASRVGGEGPA